LKVIISRELEARLRARGFRRFVPSANPVQARAGIIGRRAAPAATRTLVVPARRRPRTHRHAKGRQNGTKVVILTRAAMEPAATIPTRWRVRPEARNLSPLHRKTTQKKRAVDSIRNVVDQNR